MGCPIVLTGSITGFYAAKAGDLFEGLACEFSHDDDRVGRVIGMYFATVFLYFVGLLTYQPTAMASSIYYPITYAITTVAGGIIALLMSTGLFWGFFWVLNLLIQKYAQANLDLVSRDKS